MNDNDGPLSDFEDYDEDEEGWCETCQNMGTVECLCGGDLCICENYGEAPCPKCGGL